MKAFCELTEDRKRIEVHFLYSEEAVAAIKTIPGRHFVPKDRGGPFWTIPLEMSAAKRLRSIFGGELELGAAVTEWGKQVRAETRNLQTLAKADDAELKLLPKVLPELAAFLRNYQRADTAMMARANVLDANEPGLGKTIEVIASVYEGGLDWGRHLVVAPKTSLETVWRAELERWTNDSVFTLSGDTTYEEWQHQLAIMKMLLKEDSPFWFITTAAQVRDGLSAPLNSIFWNTFTVDEFHTTGLTNVSGDPSTGTKFGRVVRSIKRKRMYLVSGTPMGGKPIKLWGALHHMYPERFASKWRWAEEWLVISDNGYGKVIGGLRKDRIDDFYPEHAQYIIRRLKSEVAPELPPKQHVDVWCKMLSAQTKQYEQMERNAEIRIEEERLSAVGILAEYTRLKQFANAKCKIVRREKANGEEVVRLVPQSSGKLEYLLERLAERGIRKDDPVGDDVAVVASQSREYVDWVTDELNKRGIPAEKITGKINAKQRTDLVKRFQSGTNSPRVCVVTTTAGGISITLDKADSVHIMDQTWDPDNEGQVEDRLHRISRIHQVTCYYYRSRGTIEEYIYDVAKDKKITTEEILDIRRQMFKKN